MANSHKLMLTKLMIGETTLIKVNCIQICLIRTVILRHILNVSVLDRLNLGGMSGLLGCGLRFAKPNAIG